MVTGLATVLGIGYVYGITRANIPETFSHFIFDAGVVGLYVGQLFRPLSAAQRLAIKRLKTWFVLLIAWPVLLFLVPIQDPLVQLVGLRGNIFLLPFLLLGARLQGAGLYRLALCAAGLNLMAFVFAVVEFFFGVDRLFPYSAVTELVYKSRDVADYTSFRIPASFTGAHAYAGTMVMTIPLLVGAWVQKHKRAWQEYLFVAALMASLLGVLMAGARTHVVVLTVLLIVITLSGGLKSASRLSWVTIVFGVGWMISSEERLLRFMTLQDLDYVSERISHSVNMNFFELASNYPLGNGLGGGGTSLPYFLQHLIEDPVAMESEYARIMLEQGLPGLFIWLAFVAFVFSRRVARAREPWDLGRRLAWFACAAYFATGLIGVGLLTSIPQTSLLLLLTGWLAVPQPSAAHHQQTYLKAARQISPVSSQGG